MTLQDVFDILIKRFWIKPPPNLEPAELDEWKTTFYQDTVRSDLEVCSFLEHELNHLVVIIESLLPLRPWSPMKRC